MPSESSRASTPAPRPAIVYGPAAAAEPPWPGSSYRSSRKLLPSSPTCQAHTAALVPNEVPRTRPGAAGGPVSGAASASGTAAGPGIEEDWSDIKEDGLVLA